MIKYVHSYLLWPEEDVVLLQNVEDAKEGVVVLAEKVLLVQVAEHEGLVDRLPTDELQQLNVVVVPVRLRVLHPFGQEFE